MAAPLDGGLAGLVHPRKNGSNVVVITSALHAVGRRFEPGIQYDSLFFAPRGVDARRASHTNFYARESRGRREDNRTSSISVGLLGIFRKVLEVGQLTIVDHWWVTVASSAAFAAAPGVAAAITVDALLLELITVPVLRSVFHPARPFFLLHVHGDAAADGSRRDDRARAERSQDEG